MADERVSVLRPRPWWARALLAVPRAIVGVLVLVLGVVIVLLLVAIVLVVAAVVVVLWLVALLIAGIVRVFRRRYPIVAPVPRWPWQLGRIGRVYSDLLGRRLADTVSAVSGFAALFIGLAAVLASPALLVTRRRRRRALEPAPVGMPLAGWGLLPRVVRILIDEGIALGAFRDGSGVAVEPYLLWVRGAFPSIGAFLAWWDSGGRDDRPGTSPPDLGILAALDLGQLSIGPQRDPFGEPGIASVVMQRREVRDLRDLFLSAREIDDLCDPNLDGRPDTAVVRVVEVTDAGGGRRWIVQVSSTQSWSPIAGTAANDLTADLVAIGGRRSRLFEGALEAMAQAGVGADEPVLVTGFSLGGIIAAQLATGWMHGYRVTHLVVGGAPIALFPIADDVAVLTIEHVLDPVHRLDGRPREARGGFSDVAWHAVRGYPPMPPEYTIGHLHHAPSYAETARLFAAIEPAGVAFADGAAAFFSGTQRIADWAVVREGPATAAPALPVYLQRGTPDGMTRGRLRDLLRRVDGVIACDVYLSRSGFPSTKSWSVDLLVKRLAPWLDVPTQQFVFDALAELDSAQQVVTFHLRVQPADANGFLTLFRERRENGEWSRHATTA